MSGDLKYKEYNGKTYQLAKQAKMKDELSSWMNENNIKRDFNFKIHKLDDGFGIWLSYKD